MNTDFVPPSLTSLAEVDVAEVEYESTTTQIIGVVSPKSQAGWPATADFEVHTFTLAAWRYENDSAIEDELTVLRPVAPESDWYGDLITGNVLSLEVLLSTDRTRAVMSKLIERDVDDVPLKTVAQELEEPVKVETQKFGTLVLDRRIDWFRGKTIWNRHEVQISFQASDEAQLAEQLKTAHALLDAEAQWQEKIESLVISEKLPLANQWRSDATRPISERQFLDRMNLESISISSNGKFEFWHDDGELFHGHSIQITGSLDEGLTRSDIPG